MSPHLKNAFPQATLIAWTNGGLAMPRLKIGVMVESFRLPLRDGIRKAMSFLRGLENAL